MNWNVVVPNLTSELQNFVEGTVSGKQLYASAIQKSLGPEVRPLIRGGVVRARKVTREALRRRGLLNAATV